MPTYTAQRIDKGHNLGDKIVFEAQADPAYPGDTDLKAAHRIASDGIDPYSGVWVDVQLLREDNNAKP